MVALFAFIVAMGLVAGIVCLNGLVLSVLWNWFMVPLGLHPIGVALAIGLGTIVAIMTPTHKNTEKHWFLNYVTKLVLLLAIGWIAHKCM